MTAHPTMYGELASWFHLLTRPDDYAIEAEFYGQVLKESAEIPLETVLEFGSGGGNNASHLKEIFDLTLTDISEEMLALSEGINSSVTTGMDGVRWGQACLT